MVARRSGRDGVAFFGNGRRQGAAGLAALHHHLVVAAVGLHLGLGVRTVATSRNFMQGSLQESKNNLDVAINGNGFFQVTLPDGRTFVTSFVGGMNVVAPNGTSAPFPLGA